MTAADLARLAIVAFVAFWLGFSTATSRLRRTLRARAWNVTPPVHYNCRSVLVGVARETVHAGEPVTVDERKP